MEIQITETVPTKLITVTTLDHSGDKTCFLETNKAIEHVTNEHFQFGRFPYIGSNFFVFHATGLNDISTLTGDKIRFKELLDEGDSPVVYLTGALQGGKEYTYIAPETFRDFFWF